ncbi:MAG TPA: tRNA preQ1(34) S-adenosylmethionine ribosyltransferase-isomerase QueA [Steroidobacteraceae bacterium]|nr:tRNA preQ1(34) S-adenosylmethionine ribosyltransferase-isomerase QueA [Steroidobacteraceae bacterium]
MLLSDFAFDLPTELIAQAPLPERSASRLLVLPPQGGLQDLGMRDFPGLLAADDLLVFNDTRVIAARVMGTKPTGGRVEIFLERILADGTALVQLRAGKAIRPGLGILTAGGPVEVLGPLQDLWQVRTPGAPLEFFETHGAVPLPPYIQRGAGVEDRERYQSIFARDPGAVAAPTASLHFDTTLLAALRARGVRHTCVTLHVGAGTFQPVRNPDLGRHVLHEERVVVPAEACAAIAETRARGRRVIAVGTTVVRALEAAALTGGPDGAGPVPWSGDTRLFIRPGFRFQVIDGLLTNFHLPESTLLMLVCALAGRERVLAAYAHAVRAGYRFFSYGDAMFVTPVAAHG